MNAEEALNLVFGEGLDGLDSGEETDIEEDPDFPLRLTPLTQNAVILLKSLIQTLSLRVQDVLVRPMQKQVIHE